MLPLQQTEKRACLGKREEHYGKRGWGRSRNHANSSATQKGLLILEEGTSPGCKEKQARLYPKRREGEKPLKTPNRPKREILACRRKGATIARGGGRTRKKGTRLIRGRKGVKAISTDNRASKGAPQRSRGDAA